jgi:hypothetical protein
MAPVCLGFAKNPHEAADALRHAEGHFFRIIFAESKLRRHADNFLQVIRPKVLNIDLFPFGI